MNHISIFVSSTFNDMQSERDIIRERIAPELEKHINKFGCSVDFIDLRWGINTQSVSENDASKKILRTCFSEIKKTKPFFIALIGERYGWIPDKNDVLEAFKNEGLEADPDTDKSITELEIACATKLYARKNKCFFYFRNEIDYGEDEIAKRAFVSNYEQRDKITKLKKYIENEFPDQIRAYSADWNIDRQRIVGLNNFEKQLYEDLISAIDDELKNIGKPENSIEESINITNSAITTMSDIFSGRHEELACVNDFLQSHTQLLCLIGESGSGKSSVMAKIADISVQEGKCVVPFFVGIDDFSVTIENMLKSAIVRLSKCLNIDLCFDAHAVEFDYKELLKQFFTLLNKVALTKQVIVLVDALNQLLNSPLEEKLKWINLFALNPNIKIIVSCTNDYYQLNIIKALNAELLNLEYFSVSDIAEVTAHYFTVNHKEVDDKLIDAIRNKRSGDFYLCSLPVYLLTILQQLNNIDGDDFAAIHSRESALGETAGDAIINYLTEIVTSAPDEIGALLDVSLARVAKKVGDIAYLFTGVIALSRRGITEKYIEKLCSVLNVSFDSMSFSYYRKLMKCSLSERENGAWDFNHTIIKKHFRISMDNQTKETILNCMTEILSKEENTAHFKKSDYVYWLNLSNRLDLFAPYFNEQKDDQSVCEAFLSELQADPSSDKILKLLFPATNNTCAIWEFLSVSIKNGSFSHVDCNRLGCKILNSIYSYIFNDNTYKIKIILDIYVALGLASDHSGYYELAIDYLNIAIKLNKKARDIRTDILLYSELAECYFALGKGKKSLKLRKRVISICEKCGTREEILNENYMACIQRTRELVLNYKPIRNYLKNMISIIEQGVLDKEQTALWSVRILRQAELINMPIEELNFAVFTCKRYISEDDSEPFRCAEAAYALALILFNNSPLESQTYLSRARNYIETAIRADNNAEWIALYYNIICFDLFMAKCKSQDTKALNDEKIKCLQLLLAISPTFTYADDFLLNEKKHCKTTDKCAEIDSETHIFASRLRKKLSQGQIPAEQKIINKFLLIVAITLSSLFLFIMPIFFSIFRGYVGLILINNSIYLVFMRFYIPAAIETLFNMFAGFTFYGIIRLVRVRHDYLAKKLWFRRACIFLVITIVIFTVHVIDWNYLDSVPLKNKYSYLSVGLPYLLLLFMQIVPVILILNTIMDYIAIGRLSRSKRINFEKFIFSYKNNMFNLIEEMLFFVLSFGLYYTFCTINANNKYGGMVLYGSEVYNYIMIVLSVLLVIKAVYYTILFLKMRKENAKIYKN